jgi:FAD/FMN-containing dehydrogenase
MPSRNERVLNTFESWGRYPSAGDQNVLSLSWLDEADQKLATLAQSGNRFLPRGLGRSYGDSCLVTPEDTLLLTVGCNKILSFDRQTGVIRTEAGVSLEQLLSVILPAGWFLPVTPGTKFVTVAGAIANDIHGKNHHAAGNFGNHVECFELLRSDGRRIICSESDTPQSESGQLFQATIGGMGLTGIILWAQFRLKPVVGSLIQQEVIKFKGIQDFVRISRESEKDFEYTVSWVDCLSSGDNLRGLFMRGNHSDKKTVGVLESKPKAIVPIDFPSLTLNPLTVRAFNTLYYNKQLVAQKTMVTHYDPFFYPLDAVLQWNRIYGSKGFLQYQFVIPYEDDEGRAVNRIMERIAKSGQGSFLAVLKVFGDISGRGMLSFPRPGITLALDFKNTGESLYRMLEELDRMVIDAGGAIYPAKDARMSQATFNASFPRAAEFKQFIDPKIQSRFSNRIGLTS